FQVPGGGHFLSQIVLYLLENIQQRGWNAHLIAYRKSQAVSLVRAVVWVLAQYHYLHLVKRAFGKSVEDLAACRINFLRNVFVFNKGHKIFEIRLFKFILQYILPAFFYLYMHAVYV